MAESHVPIYTFDEVMRDLCVRFVINNPPAEYNNSIHFLFFLELAYWFYLDNWVRLLPYLPVYVDFKPFIEACLADAD